MPAARCLAGSPLDTVDSPYPFSISTAQTETERVLTERLSEFGVEIERGVELVGFEQDEHEVRSTLRHADGREEICVSSWIAGTDGSHSTVRDVVGTRLAGLVQGRAFPARRCRGRLRPRPRLDALLLFGERRASARVPDGRRSAAPDRADRRVRRAVDATLQQLQAICDQRAGGITLRNPRTGSRSSRSITLRCPPTASGGRFSPVTPPTSTARPAVRV